MSAEDVTLYRATSIAVIRALSLSLSLSWRAAWTRSSRRLVSFVVGMSVIRVMSTQLSTVQSPVWGRCLARIPKKEVTRNNEPKDTCNVLVLLLRCRVELASCDFYPSFCLLDERLAFISSPGMTNLLLPVCQKNRLLIEKRVVALFNEFEKDMQICVIWVNAECKMIGVNCLFKKKGEHIYLMNIVFIYKYWKISKNSVTTRRHNY